MQQRLSRGKLEMMFAVINGSGVWSTNLCLGAFDALGRQRGGHVGYDREVPASEQFRSCLGFASIWVTRCFAVLRCHPEYGEFIHSRIALWIDDRLQVDQHWNVTSFKPSFYKTFINSRSCCRTRRNPQLEYLQTSILPNVRVRTRVSARFHLPVSGLTFASFNSPWNQNDPRHKSAIVEQTNAISCKGRDAMDIDDNPYTLWI